MILRPLYTGLPPPQADDEAKPTAAELKEAFSSHISQRHGPDAPLMTQAMRQREEARLGIKKKEYHEVSAPPTSPLLLEENKQLHPPRRPRLSFCLTTDPNTNPSVRSDDARRHLSLDGSGPDAVSLPPCAPLAETRQTCIYPLPIAAETGPGRKHKGRQAAGQDAARARHGTRRRRACALVRCRHECQHLSSAAQRRDTGPGTGPAHAALLRRPVSRPDAARSIVISCKGQRRVGVRRDKKGRSTFPPFSFLFPFTGSDLFSALIQAMPKWLKGLQSGCSSFANSMHS